MDRQTRQIVGWLLAVLVLWGIHKVLPYIRSAPPMVFPVQEIIESETVSAAFEEGEQIELDGKLVTIHQERVGELYERSSKLSACGGAVCHQYFAPPVPPGRHEVVLVVAQLSPEDGVPLFLRLELSDAAIAAWKKTGNASGPDGPPGGWPLFTTGHALALFDFEATELAWKRFKPSQSDLAGFADRALRGRSEPARIVELDSRTGLNLVAVRLAEDVVVVDSYFGFDAEGGVVSIVFSLTKG